MLAAANLVRSRSWWAAVSLLLVVGMVTAIRVRLLELPLERDEGEYAYAGQLLLEGTPPYRELYSMKWPGTFGVYAASMWLFGQSVAGVHIGLILTNVLTALIVFLIGKRIYGSLAASVAAGIYALLSISPPTLGLAAHATHFVLPPTLCGVLLLQRLNEQSSAWRVGLAGVLFGLATLMKQSGAILALFGAAWLLWLENSEPKRDLRRLLMRLATLSAGAALPLGITAALLATAGVFGRFWLWTVQYSRAYAGLLTPVEGARFLGENAGRLFEAAPGLWCLALLGLVLLWLKPALRPWRFFVTGFALFSFLSVCPGWYFREHYFLLFLPAAGLLAGSAVAGLKSPGTRNSDLPSADQQSQPRPMDGGPSLGGGFPLTSHMQRDHEPAAGRRLERQARRLPHSPRFIQKYGQPAAFAVFILAAAWSLYSSRVLFFQASPESASHLLYPGNAFPECARLGQYLFEHSPADARLAVLGSEPELFFYSHRRSATGYIYMYPLMEPQPYAKAMQEDMIRELLAASPADYVFVGVSSSWLPRSDSDLSILSWFESYQKEHLCPIALVQLFSDDHIQYDWSPLNPPEAGRPKRWLEAYRRATN